MKILKQLFVVVISIIAFNSCQKELSFEGGLSFGYVVKSSISGYCTPATVTGIFRKDSVLSNANYVDIQVNVLLGGTFDIKSDTVNGYSFHKTGSVGTGINTIRLYPKGKPLSIGINTFTVKYDSTICTFDIFVIDATSGTAIYTLGGAPGNCTTFTVAGTYTSGTMLGAGNTVSFDVNVSVAGTYSITTNTINGMTFSTSGVFTNTGAGQIVTLVGSGAPTNPGVTLFSPTSGTSSCKYSITVLPGGSPAVYTLGGNPGSCTSVVLNGTYTAGATTTASNTVTVDVTVTSPGTYTLSTTTVNNLNFSASGVFAVAGATTVTLNANIAIPAGSGLFNYPITGASSTCTFPITFAAPPPPAVFTLSGDPGTCTPATVNGTYTAGTALNASNTVDVEVNVTGLGTYTIATNTVNGMKFTASGVFTMMGLQNVTLNPTAGSNPVAAGTSTFTPLAGTSSCTFDVLVDPAMGMYSFKIGTTVYSGPCDGLLTDLGGGSEQMDIGGTGPDGFTLSMINPTGAISAGTYIGTSTVGKYVTFDFNQGLTLLIASDPAIPAPFATNLSAVITSINTVTHVVQGTFSGTALNFITTNLVTVTNGTFIANY